MIVPAKPMLQLGAFKSTGPPSPPWHDCTFFKSGCDALGHALLRLGLPAGSAVVVPSLICRSVPNRIEALGFFPIFVDSAKDHPCPTLGDIKAACSDPRVRAVLLVHFFGFDPPERAEIIKLSHESGCLVIEDRCHSALSVTEHAPADAVIYSLRKTIPSPDGGALWLSAKFSRDRAPFVQSKVQTLAFILVRLVENSVYYFGWPNLYGLMLTSARKFMRNILSYKANNHHLEFKQSPISPSWILARQICNSGYLEKVSRRRQVNYHQLAEILPIVPLFNSTEFESIPYVFPVLDVNGGLLDYLRQQGVGASSWPGNEWPEVVEASAHLYPNTHRLNHQIVCLPIHQSLNYSHLRKMSILIKKYIQPLI